MHMILCILCTYSPWSFISQSIILCKNNKTRKTMLTNSAAITSLENHLRTVKKIVSTIFN